MMNEEKKNVPALRFPGFEGEWEIARLEDVYPEIVVGFVGTISDSYCDAEDGIPLIRTLNVRDGYFTLDNIEYVTPKFHNANKKSKIYNNDILIARVGANMGQVCKVEKLTTEANSANVIILKNFKDNDSGFFALYLGSQNGQQQILARGAGGAQAVLNISVAKTIIVPRPTLPEQQKIASFLTAVDEKLQALKKKKRLLEEYKRGLMQKIFSQELRFKDDEGNDFPDWEEKKLGEVLDYIQPTKYLVASTEYGDSFETPVLTAGKTFILGYTDETEGIYQENLPVIIFDDFTTSTQFVDFPFKAKSSAMKILIAQEGFNIYFVYAAMQLLDYTVGGHERHWISKFSHLEISVPSFEEQNRVAEFLVFIDEKINYCSNLITQTENWKKGLLQELFV